jgi:uncharacterized protein YcnI
MRRLCLCAAAMLGALVIVGGAATLASAHVTVSPPALPKGTSDVVLTFRVPNESTTASVVGLKVQFPLAHPIVLVNPEAGSGWQVNETKSALPKPITTDDGTFTTVTSEIDWSGGTIGVGQFGEFNVLAQGIPSDTDQLVFKAIQTYSDGSVVSWIQVPTKAVPDPPHPAPTITLTSAGDAPAGTATTAPASAAPAAASGGSGNNALAVAALILGGVAVVLALLAVWLGRPRFGGRDEGDERDEGAEIAEGAAS